MELVTGLVSCPLALVLQEFELERRFHILFTAHSHIAVSFQLAI
jgi:hypothetical protein